MASHPQADKARLLAGRITIVGLGPAGSELVTPETLAAIEAHERRYLRTTVHPAAEVVTQAQSFDHLYETSDTFAEIYRGIADSLIHASADGDVLYAVPGSPLVLERTVAILRDEANNGTVDLSILAAMSFLDIAWARLGIDPVEESVRLIDGHAFAAAAAGQTGPLLVAHCHARHVLSDIKLSIDDGPDEVIVLQRLGSPDESITTVRWADLDRDIDADHLTSIYIPTLASPVAAEFVRFDELVRVLRDKCPWDRKQTHASLRRHLLEEAHETIEALDARAAMDDQEVDPDTDAHLNEELGDLLYQIFFHARVAAERGSFDITEVVTGIHDKLVSRHPHVFAGVRADDVDTVLSNWDQIKQAEKDRHSALDGIPPSLPALMLATKLLKRASSSGVEVGAVATSAAAMADTLSRVLSSPDDESLGELLFAVVTLAGDLDLDAEEALRGAARRFEAQFRDAEMGVDEAPGNRTD